MPEDVPSAFLTLFRDVVRAYQPRAVDPGAPRVYWDTLRVYPLAILEASAARLTQQQAFFPTAAEWYQAARCLAGAQQAAQRAAGPCAPCHGFGAVRIHYASGEPFDIALCECHAGQVFVRLGEAVVRARFGLSEAHRVGVIADFTDPADPPGLPL
jgi:hypothetical protein